MGYEFTSEVTRRGVCTSRQKKLRIKLGCSKSTDLEVSKREARVLGIRGDLFCELLASE